MGNFAIANSRGVIFQTVDFVMGTQTAGGTQPTWVVPAAETEIFTAALTRRTLLIPNTILNCWLVGYLSQYPPGGVSDCSLWVKATRNGFSSGITTSAWQDITGHVTLPAGATQSPFFGGYPTTPIQTTMTALGVGPGDAITLAVVGKCPSGATPTIKFDYLAMQFAYYVPGDMGSYFL